MSGQKRWKHGGVTYPLSDDTDEDLLLAADPALYYAIELFKAVIEEHVGPRLLAQTAEYGYRYPSAVVKTLHYHPKPYLLSADIKLPLFGLWRSEETWALNTASFELENSTWEWCYVLPPLTPVEIEQLHPILRSVAVTVSSFAMQSFDPSWEAGKTLRDLSGIASMRAGPVRYQDIELLADDDVEKWWLSVGGRIHVQEKRDFALEDMGMFQGASIDIDLASEAQGTVEAFVEVDVHAAPELERINPTSGTKAGGTPFEILTPRPCLRPGTTYRVLFGGAYASSVVCTNPTRLVGVTPEHEANPTFPADVQVFDDQDNPSNVLEGAFTFTTP